MREKYNIFTMLHSKDENILSLVKRYGNRNRYSMIISYWRAFRNTKKYLRSIFNEQNQVRLFCSKHAKLSPEVSTLLCARGKRLAASLFLRSMQKAAKFMMLSGNEYIDYVLSWGPMILGHAHPKVIAAICDTAKKGTSFGAPTQVETQMANLISEAIPSIELLRMTSSGTEATMTAIRLARGFTGRNLIAKFDGCYHGHTDSLLIKAGSGIATFGIPGSPGIPAELAKLTLSLPYNDMDALQKQ